MPPHVNRTMTPFEWGLLILLALLWGGSYFYNAVALKELPPLSIVAARAGGGAVILYLVVRARGLTMPRDAATWRGFFTMGFLSSGREGWRSGRAVVPAARGRRRSAAATAHRGPAATRSPARPQMSTTLL